MDKKRVAYGIGGLAGIVVLGSLICSGPKEEVEIKPLAPPKIDSARKIITLPETRITHTYSVQPGDYLFKIVQKELGLTGNDIYTKGCLDIQVNNNLGSERDTHKVVDGKLVPGKDGFVDLLYPGEKLQLE